MSKKSELDLEFKRGYYIAVANLVRLHGCDVEARETLQQYGNPNFRGIDPFDVKVLKPLDDEIKRFRKLLNNQNSKP